MCTIGIDACGYIYGSCSLSVCILLSRDALEGHAGVLICKSFRISRMGLHIYIHNHRVCVLENKIWLQSQYSDW